MKKAVMKGRRWCSHCEKETDFRMVAPRLYAIAMSHRECVACGYSVEFSYPPAQKEEVTDEGL